jgi:hypothetical protein
MKLIVADFKSLKSLLRKSRELVDDAVDTSKAACDTRRAIRLKGISRQIEDELSDLDRRLAEAERAVKE